ncbi:MAG: MgtC/SapB family protein [Anaerolineales bacterium]|nr:MgtC/SapB family protein [Anaerolineales bacterium]
METSPMWLAQLPGYFDWTDVLRLSLAALLGGIVGFERELTGHPAGLRTNILVSTSSCLFTILSIKGFPLVGAAQDTARIAAQVVTGVGFLGAGAVIQTKRAVHGLTTAATIWMVAAVGMAAATDLYLLGILTTLLTTGVLVLLAPLSIWLGAKSESYHVRHQAIYERIKAQEQEAEAEENGAE